MATVKFFYPNCDCCSGSGSASGSCSCSFLWNAALCTVPPCPTSFMATIRLNFSGCGSSTIGSCGSSGSSGSSDGPSTGGDFEPTGSASGSDCRTCPDCCSIANKIWQVELLCLGDNLVSETVIYDGSGSNQCFQSSELGGQTGSDTCLGFRTDRCYSGVVTSNSGSIDSAFVLPLDGGFITLSSTGMIVNSCDPFMLSGIVSNVSFGEIFPTSGSRSSPQSLFPCLFPCISDGFFDETGIYASCVTGTVTITELTPP